MKEIDITSFLTPQVLEFISTNPDILSLLFSSGSKNDNNEYTEEINELKVRLDYLESEIAELKAIATEATKTAPSSANESKNDGKYNLSKIKKTSNSSGQKFSY